MKNLIISAPFGNWISHPDATSTLGTFTVEKRDGILGWYRWWRVLLTLRRNRKADGWTNRLGLPNPGIHWLLSKTQRHWDEDAAAHYHSTVIRDKIVSLHGFNADDWADLLCRMPQLAEQGNAPAALELNVSCVNVVDAPLRRKMFLTAVELGLPVIVKLPPTQWKATFESAAEAGVTRFHCTNTLSTPAGGMSGKPLRSVALDVVEAVRKLMPAADIIGGGGITTPADIVDYRHAGANRFAIASGLLRLRYLLPRVRNRYLCGLAAAAAQP